MKLAILVDWYKYLAPTLPGDELIRFRLECSTSISTNKARIYWIKQGLSRFEHDLQNDFHTIVVRFQVGSNRDKPSLIVYIRALLLHTRATFKYKSYQLITRHSWSSILVPVNLCITECTVLEPCDQPCSV